MNDSQPNKIMEIKLNWWHRVKSYFRSSRHEPTLARIFLSYTDAMKEKDCMRAFCRSNINKCDDPLFHALPSRKLIKIYNLNLSKINGECWWLLEQYFNGNLVFKQKGKKNYEYKTQNRTK